MVLIKKEFSKKDKFKTVDEFISSVIDKLSSETEINIDIKILHQSKDVAVTLKIEDTVLH